MISGKTLARLAASAFASLLLVGCATMPPAGDTEALAAYNEVNDPLEPFNRAVFSFNEGFDQVLLKPVAQGYRFIVPEFGRDRIGDFLANLREPLNLGNNILQGNVERAIASFLRFLVNSSFGVLGTIDIASEMGLPDTSEDFGQTLAVWGLGEGPYLVLPFLGPSNPRDGVGLVVDSYLDPVNRYFVNNDLEWATYTRTGVTVIHQRSESIDVLEDLKRTSLDYYSTIRSLYRQRREALISNNATNGPSAADFAPAATDTISQSN